MGVIERSHVIAEVAAHPIQVANVVLSSAQILALNATPITLIAAPPAGKALVFEGAEIHKPAGTAYAGIAGGEDLSIKYTNGSGLEVGVCEMTGFADQTTTQFRYIRAIDARDVTSATNAGTPSSLVAVAAAALVAHMLVGEITTGNSPFNFKIFYRVIDIALS